MKKKQATQKVDKPSNRKSLVLKKLMARGKYNIVDGSSYTIEGTSAENRSEDEILTESKRARLLDATRNLVRNSSLFNTILGQMTTNVVSTCGGKVVLDFPDDTTNKQLRKVFSSWTLNTDFYTGDKFNHLLKRVLREYVIGGEVVLLFDDNLVEDSGKVLVFESNEIVNVPTSEVEKRYGKGATISQGKVYSKNGRHIGTVVSKSQKGMGQNIDPNKCYYLKKDPDENPMNRNWFQFSCNWREGRGVSQASSAIATIHQLEDLVQSELLASRRNSQIFCWLTENSGSSETLPSGFDTTLNVNELTDEEVEELSKSVGQEKTVSFNKARENSIVYEQLPEGFDAKQLQMTHPNSNVEVMVDWLANRCASTLGLSRVFATGNPDDANFRANQLFSYPAIVELQKDLESITDWCFANFVRWAKRKGLLNLNIGDDVLEFVSWEWKGLDDLDEVSHQNAIKLQLQNMTKTYKEILGNSWREKMIQTADERKWLKEHGITHPSDLMLSGGQTDGSKVEEELIET